MAAAVESQRVVSPARIGLGCVTFGREINEDSALAILDHAYMRGVRHYDTAASYGGGSSETILGKWLASRKPDGVEIATKVLPPYDKLDVCQSLERLGTASLDLLYAHQWHESLLHNKGLFAGLRAEGIVRRLGVSNVSLPQLDSVADVFDVVQNNHNLAVSDLGPDMLRYCHARGILAVGYSPLGAGFLTGKHRQSVESGSRFQVVPGHQDVYFHPHCWQRLDQLERASSESGVPQWKLALAWALRTAGVGEVLVGGRSTRHVDQAFEALEFDDDALLASLTDCSTPADDKTDSPRFG